MVRKYCRFTEWSKKFGRGVSHPVHSPRGHFPSLFRGDVFTSCLIPGFFCGRMAPSYVLCLRKTGMADTTLSTNESVAKSDIRRKKGSKRAKKNWRKGTDIEDVEDHLEDIRRQERTGCVFSDYAGFTNPIFQVSSFLTNILLSSLAIFVNVAKEMGQGKKDCVFDYQ